MKRHVAIGMALSLLSSVASANLLTNPGFEDPGPTPWWSGVFGSSGGAWYWENHPQARSGNDLVAIGFWGSGNTGYWGQTLSSVSPGTVFDFTVWTKTEAGFVGDVFLMVEFKDSGGGMLATNYSATLSGERTTYEQLQLITDPAPAGTTEVTFQMRASGGVNSALFDDASVVVIPEPASAGLTGAGLLAGLGCLWRRCRSRA